MLTCPPPPRTNTSPSSLIGACWPAGPAAPWGSATGRRPGPRRSPRLAVRAEAAGRYRRAVGPPGPREGLLGQALLGPPPHLRQPVPAAPPGPAVPPDGHHHGRHA